VIVQDDASELRFAGFGALFALNRPKCRQNGCQLMAHEESTILVSGRFVLGDYWLAVLAGPLSITVACSVFTRVWRGGLNQQDSPVTFAAGTAGLNCTTSQSDLTEDSRRRNETLTNFS
jgi:hypothetical protein